MLLFGALLTYPAAHYVGVLRRKQMQEKLNKLFEQMANAGQLTKADLDFAFRMGYHTGKIEVLEERIK